MEIIKNRQDAALTVQLVGRLDTTTAPSLEEALAEELPQLTELTFDLNGLEYISSAGLRVFLLTQKQINREEKQMTVCNVAPEIREVFDLTGFSDFLNIQ